MLKGILLIAAAGLCFAEDAKMPELDLERLKRTDAELALFESRINQIKQEAQPAVKLQTELVQKYCAAAGVPKDKIETECMIDRTTGVFTWKKPPPTSAAPSQ